METSSFDPCLLITANNIADKDLFGIAALQTDDTFIVGTDAFLKIEEKELCFKAKPKRFSKKAEGQAQTSRRSIFRHQVGIRIMLLNAPGAYIASICQPEATYDCSVAAQAQEPVNTDFKALNKRIEWQINNPDRGLCYIPIDLESAKIFVFTDGSFANNKDLSSQIGFVIIIANETAQSTDSFSIRGNILHWSSTKYSYSLYECLVKLGTTTEKRLMIDIMALRQAYESRDIAEIRWVNGADNPADAMTKASPNSALTQFISDNQLNVRVEGFVHRNNTTILDEI
ncbi:polyprotein [Hirsutella rhossiliensis]|uniref:Polyprotein n=1 Tax=Hirsutella rhossiliensis TaxID=111463 RepID=A0A9P8SEI8_9HYPO|nr:polyprotein [Hirsutella rhossiliensis]KAH0959029.1 polyprotein [Hirsutella rhossiliensis]